MKMPRRNAGGEIVFTFYACHLILIGIFTFQKKNKIKISYTMSLTVKLNFAKLPFQKERVTGANARGCNINYFPLLF
jgi:hypothetical protein